MTDVKASTKILHRRWADLSVRLKGLAVFAAPIASLLLLSSLCTYYLVSAKTEADIAAKNTLEVRSQLQNLYIVLISAESEIRNYGLNGHEEGLQPLGMVGPTVDALLTRIGELLQDTNPQKERIARLRQLAHERLNGLQELRAYYKSPDGHSTPPPAQLIQRARISPDLLVALSEIGNKQNKLQLERAKTDEARQAWLRFAIIGTNVMALFIGIFAALWFTKGIVRRLHTLREAALRSAEGLASDLAPSGNDELGRLAAAMETASRHAAAQSTELKLALEGAET